jgi:hypothetical protein
MSETGERARFDLVVAAVSGLASVALVLGTLAVEQIRVTHEVQLWAPERAQAGDRLPVRALVLTDLDGAAGPRLVQEGISAAMLFEGDAEETTGVALEPAALGTLEGQLGLVEPGAERIAARVRLEDALVATVVRPLRVEARADQPLPVRDRLGDALQVLQLGRTDEVRAVAPELEVRVVGGVCIPDRPCELLFFRGGAPVVPGLAECTAVDVVGVRTGRSVVTVSVVVHGPEARCEVTLEPGAVTTSLQIPVGLATPWIEVTREETRLVVAGEPPIGRDEMLIDVFVGERWVSARTLRRGERLALPLEDLGDGLFRVQARADVASSERAYQRALLAARPRERAGAPGALEQARVARFGAESRAWDEERLDWELRRLEAELVDVPAPNSGLARDEGRLAATRTTMRWVAVSGVVLAVVLTLAAVGRRGLASAREAREVLVEAGAEGADDRAARWRSWLTVVAFVAAIGLAILLGAAFLVARPFFLG